MSKNKQIGIAKEKMNKTTVAIRNNIHSFARERGWTNVGVTPLAPKALKEMRYIMDGILSGKLSHHQGAWHIIRNDKDNFVIGDSRVGEDWCGTSHCFAGWGEYLGKKSEVQRKTVESVSPKFSRKEVLKYFPKTANDFIDVTPLGLCIRPEDSDSREFARDYCMKRWGIKEGEADALFSGSNTPDELNVVVSLLEAGYRINYPSFRFSSLY